jgi:hypothetical protein
VKWFIKSGDGDLYWSQARGDWGPIERATAYAFDDIVTAPMPLAFAPVWVRLAI